MKLIGIKGGKLQHNARNFKGNQIKIMRIRKKQCSKSIDDIGNDNYNFDFYSEIIIYKDLCCKRLTAKEKKKQVGLPKFNRYKDWKSYIVREYGVTEYASSISCHFKSDFALDILRREMERGVREGGSLL